MKSVEFDRVLARQRMVRPPYADRPVSPELVDQIMGAAVKAPSAGFSQGASFVVLEGAETEAFWTITRPLTTPGDHPRTPVIAIPLEDSAAYLARYSEPDKVEFGLGSGTEAWPAPYWTVDTAFATMCVLLSATAHGLGAWFFGIFAGEDELMDHLGVPEGIRPIGALAMGWPSPDEQRKSSVFRQRRRPLAYVVRRSSW